MMRPHDDSYMDTVISIQARLGSTRLPGKVLLHLGDHRILHWVVNRALSVDLEQTDVVVALGDEPENEAIEELCQRKNYESIIGPEDDLVERHLQVASSGDYDTLVRLTADCPFVPSSEINRVIAEHERNDGRYTTNATDQMPIGTAVDVIDRDVLEELRELGDSHPVHRLRENPEEWAIVVTPNDQWTAVGEAHTAVDTPADYWQLVDAVKTVGTEPRAVTDWIAER
jgi:spore coat polysaccharide biosynthesis protein SpsF